jgi:NAD(P)-dependent dehydrogenase (short-subunit alcohol dehydrogenase family)
MMGFDFSGKNAIVAGAGSGIGQAIALQLAKNGAGVWIGDIGEDGAAKTVAALAPYGGTYGFTKTNVAQKEDVVRLFGDAKSAFGEIHIVVNSAGVFSTPNLTEATPEQIKDHLDINLLGVIYGTQLALEMMIAQGKGGKIVNVSSVGGRGGELGSPYYSLGKSGIINFTQSAALTGAPHAINVNAICPGIIRTPMWDVILADATNGDPAADREAVFQEMVKARTPLGRAQTAEEMAYAVCFLCSAYANAIVGQALNVDGGSRMN